MDTLTKLIAIPSESRSEQAIAQFIVSWLKERGINAHTQADNVVAHIPGKDTSKALIFNGHIDTVPAGDHSLWTHGPYAAKVVDGVLYGLGSSDMKAGVAGIMELAEYYQQNTPPCDIWFSFVAGEETDGHGTKSFLEWFVNEGHNTYKTVEGIIAEPTDCTYVGLGHRGNYFLRLLTPDATVEGIESLARDLTELANAWQKTYTHPMLGAPTLAVTGIDFSIDSASPATITVDIRTTPELHPELIAHLQAFLQKSHNSTTVESISECPVGWCPDNGIIRGIATSHFPDLAQHVMTGSTDLCFFSEQNIPCVIYGPGQREKMHAVNETFVCEKLAEFVATAKEMVEYYGKK